MISFFHLIPSLFRNDTFLFTGMQAIRITDVSWQETAGKQRGENVMCVRMLHLLPFVTQFFSWFPCRPATRLQLSLNIIRVVLLERFAVFIYISIMKAKNIFSLVSFSSCQFMIYFYECCQNTFCSFVTMGCNGLHPNIICHYLHLTLFTWLLVKLCEL